MVKTPEANNSVTTAKREDKNLRSENIELKCRLRILEISLEPTSAIEDILRETVDYTCAALGRVASIGVRILYNRQRFQSGDIAGDANEAGCTIRFDGVPVGRFSILWPVAKDTPNLAIYLRNRFLTSIVQALERTIEFKTAQHDILESESRLRLLVENMPVLLGAYDENETYCAWNKEFERVTGYTAREMVGNPQADELLYPDKHYRETMMKKFRAMKHEFHEFEWETHCKDGSIKTISWYDISGRFPIPGWPVWGIGLDVTERKKAENALKTSKERLEHALDATNHGLWDYNVPGRKAFLSNSYYAMLDYATWETDDLVDIWQELLHPEDKKGAFEALKNCINNKVKIEIEFRMRATSGEWRWILCRGKSFAEDAEGKSVRIVGTHVDITPRKLEEESRRKSEEYLRLENKRLKSSFQDRYKFLDIIGKSPKMQSLYELILKAAANNNNVILFGESGTGKELAAKAIHKLSDRANKSFIPVNCGAITESLLESELFGYVKGAFTGADRNKIGLLASADGGTLFLDEIGEISANMQIKLLRVVEGNGYTPVGGTEIIHTDFRIISATHKNLEGLLAQGAMRHDFYYRICVIPITLPPLRERKEDVPLLIEHFINQFQPEHAEFPVPANVLESFLKHDWPGNVRELQNALQRYMSLKSVDFLGQPTLGSGETDPDLTPTAEPTEIRDLKTVLAEFEKRYLIKTLEQHHWHRKKVAALLGINRKTLHLKMKRYQIP